MCGIFGYTGSAIASEILLEGLRFLEYRGYDSAGIAVLNGTISTLKSEGNISKLTEKLSKNQLSGQTGIAHTRWATHGAANETNAHPHLSNSGRYALVHNGIIDNYDEIRNTLLANGYTFYSETDTEILVNYLEYQTKELKNTIPVAISNILTDLKGSFAFCFIESEASEAIWISRKGAPLVLGVHGEEYYVSSDIHALLSHCEEAAFLENEHYAYLHKGEELEVYNKNGERASVEIMKTETIEQWGDDPTDTGQYDHVTLKEIFEQPTVMRRLLIDTDHLKEIQDIKISDYGRLVLLGCGTSLHAALFAKNIFEKCLRIPVIVEQASEFKYSDPILFPNDLVIGISQSGETADTLQACYLTRDAGIKTIGMCNSAHSTMTRELSSCIYLKAGKEIGVASTKAFTAQMMVFLQLLMTWSSDEALIQELEKSLKSVPIDMEKLLEDAPHIEQISKRFSATEHFLFIGRGLSFSMAMEGALKLKELSYIHAEGYQAAELKHGPLALLDENFPVVLVAADSGNHAKNIATANEIVSRKGQLISIVSESDKVIPGLSKEVIKIANCHDLITPLMSCIPLQLLSFYLALEKGQNVDQPRNLAKSVTVE